MIAGVATDTMVESTRIMKKPRHSANRAGHGLTSGGVVPARGTGSPGGFMVWAISQPNTRQPTFHPVAGTLVQRSFSADCDHGDLSLIHISEPTRRTPISYAV